MRYMMKISVLWRSFIDGFLSLFENQEEALIQDFKKIKERRRGIIGAFARTNQSLNKAIEKEKCEMGIDK